MYHVPTPSALGSFLLACSASHASKLQAAIAQAQLAQLLHYQQLHAEQLAQFQQQEQSRAQECQARHNPQQVRASRCVRACLCLLRVSLWLPPLSMLTRAHYDAYPRAHNTLSLPRSFTHTNAQFFTAGFC